MIGNKVKFDNVRIGNVVEVYDGYNEISAVGIVTQKREDIEAKYITIRFGFYTEEEYALEEKEGFKRGGQQTIFVNSIIQ
jgi:hypothetical protein